MRSFDIQRETEIHFTGETTLDNGLTVGFHAESDIDGFGGEDFDTEEAYAYFSGAWGRVNFGMEDGAAYLLQVAAPSADSNIDGIRQYVQPVNYGALEAAGVVAGGAIDPTLGNLFTTGTIPAGLLVDVGAAGSGAGAADAGDIIVNAGGLTSPLPVAPRLDYDQALSGYANKFTYLTPVFNGFQAGFSYTPDVNGGSRDWSNGNNIDAGGDEAYDVAARYEGQFGEVGMALGAGFSHVENGTAAPAAPAVYVDVDGSGVFTPGVDTALFNPDDQQAWNAGVDFNWGPFGLGVAYVENDFGFEDVEDETIVVGIDYTTGPFKLGGSYLNSDTDVVVGDIEAERWTGGATYTYGPGMTFRGSVSFVDIEENLGATSSDADATSIMIGTQIDF